MMTVDCDSFTNQLIDGGRRRGLLGLAGDQGVLHVRRHVQLEREGEVRVHLDGWIDVDEDEDDGVGLHLFFHHGDHVEAVTHRVESQYVRQRLEAGSLFRSHLRNQSCMYKRSLTLGKIKFEEKKNENLGAAL